MKHLQTNKDSWNQRVETHFNSKFYDVAGFLAGKTSLNDIEINGLTDVENKSLLHLQCHFGLDSLSWARLGARVTGVDIADIAIEKAQQLQAQTQLSAEFICAEITEFGSQSKQLYDIVYTSYGAVCWMPNINLWAQTVANQLKPGGQFYMAEFHPVVDLMAGYSYFHKQSADVEMEDTYTENCDGTKHEFAVWTHTMGDVISALINAGLNITAVRELDYSPYDCFDGMEELQAGKFYLQHQGQHVPMVYSINAHKPV